MSAIGYEVYTAQQAWLNAMISMDGKCFKEKNISYRPRWMNFVSTKMIPKWSNQRRHHIEGRLLICRMHSSMDAMCLTWCWSKNRYGYISYMLDFIETSWSPMIWTMPLFFDDCHWHIILEWMIWKMCTACERDAPSMLVDLCVIPPIDELPQKVGPDTLVWHERRYI